MNLRLKVSEISNFEEKLTKSLDYRNLILKLNFKTQNP